MNQKQLIIINQNNPEDDNEATKLGNKSSDLNLLHCKFENDGNARFPIERYLCYNFTREKKNADKDVLNEKLGFSHYVNVLNSFRNPDIITGDAIKFLKGNKYRAKMVNRIEEQKLKEEQEKLIAQDPEDNQDVLSEDSVDNPKAPSRYYHAESKEIRCRNWSQIGHIARHCPNESKSQLWSYCGTPHDFSALWPQMIWYKWNQSGHKAIDWKVKI